MIFLKNKYTTWYYNIIHNAIHKELSDITYTEKHHIIPKSCGGTNDHANLVRLTYKEHFICHWLLTKMVDDKLKRKMNYALSKMSRRKDLVISSGWQYQLMKIAARRANTGKKLSEETKKKLSRASIKQFENPENRHKAGNGSRNRKKSKEEIQKQMAAQKKAIKEKYGVDNISQVPEIRRKKSKKLKGRIITWGDKISKSKLGKGFRS